MQQIQNSALGYYKDYHIRYITLVFKELLLSINICLTLRCCCINSNSSFSSLLRAVDFGKKWKRLLFWLTSYKMFSSWTFCFILVIDSEPAIYANVWNLLNEAGFILFINVLVMIIIEIIMLDYSFF